MDRGSNRKSRSIGHVCVVATVLWTSAAVLASITGCSKSHQADACPSGESFEVGGALFCYYEITETGFSCPNAVPHQHDLPEGGAVCSAQKELPPELPEVIEREFYAHSDAATPMVDAGVDASSELAGTCEPLLLDPAFLTTEGSSVRWSVGDECIAVTYEADFAPYVDRIEASIAAWTDQYCSRLCFGTPTEQVGYEFLDDSWDGTVPPPRIHFRVATVEERERLDLFPEGPNAKAVTYVQYPIQTGQILTSTIFFLEPPTPQTDTARYVHEMGHAVGFAHSERKDSVMAVEPQLTMMTDSDRHAYCAMYGELPWCETDPSVARACLDGIEVVREPGWDEGCLPLREDLAVVVCMEEAEVALRNEVQRIAPSLEETLEWCDEGEVGYLFTQAWFEEGCGSGELSDAHWNTLMRVAEFEGTECIRAFPK